MAGLYVKDTQVLTGKNAAPRYRLALVRVDQRGPEHDEVRYLDDPFATTADLGTFEIATGIKGDLEQGDVVPRTPALLT